MAATATLAELTMFPAVETSEFNRCIWLLSLSTVDNESYVWHVDEQHFYLKKTLN